MMADRRRKRLAVSNILTALILVVLAIVAATAGLLIMSQQTKNLTQITSVDTGQSRFYVDPAATGGGSLTLVLTNTGTTTITLHDGQIGLKGLVNMTFFTSPIQIQYRNATGALITLRATSVTTSDARSGVTPQGLVLASQTSATIQFTGLSGISTALPPNTEYPITIHTTGPEIIAFKIVAETTGEDTGHMTTTTTTTSSSTSSSQTETRYTITFHTAPTSGTITANGTSKTDGMTGRYSSGQRIHVIANPPTGCSFTSWETSGGASIDNATSADTYMTVSNTGMLKAHFAANHYVITVTSSPAGTEFVKVDGVAVATPHAFNWTVGSTHQLEALSPISGETGIQYVWASWSDSGSKSHSYTTPATTQTVTATYATQYQLTMQVTPSGGGTTTPSVGTYWYDAGASVTISATPNSGYVFSSWSGSGTGSYTGTQNSHVLTINGPVTETANFQQTTQITITSAPVGSGLVTVDGTTITTPQTFTWIVSSTHTVAANSPVDCGTGCRYVWTTWSDAGAQSHTITVPSAATTYTAEFKTQYYLTVSSSHDSPNPTSSWIDADALVSASVNSPASGDAGTRYICTGWTGTGSAPASGTDASTSFTIDAPSTITWKWSTQYQLTMQVSQTDGGTTTPPVGTYWYDENTPLTITAITNPGHQFLEWTGTAYSGPDPSAPITMNSPIVETAEFADVATTTQVVTTTGTTTETSYETTTTTSYSTTTSTSTIYETTTTTETVSSAPPAPAETSPLTCIGYVSLLVIAIGHLRIREVCSRCGTDFDSKLQSRECPHRRKVIQPYDGI